MKRLCVFMLIFLVSAFCFAQQNAGIKVIGKIPDAGDNRLYQLQVGAYRVICNAENAFEKLRAASLNPSYEKYGDLTRVVIKGVSACVVRSCIELIRRAGFPEVLIKLDSPRAAATQPSGGRQPAGRQPSAADSSEDSYSESESDMPQNNTPEGAFNGTGTWKLTGNDPEGTEWKADIVIKNVRGNNFEGYFDWYKGPDFDFKGKEYFTGRFDASTDKIYFQGTKLENSSGLALGKYEAYVSFNREQLYNGRWEEPEDIPSSDWQATKDTGTK